MMNDWLSKYRRLNLVGKLIVLHIAIWIVTQLVRLTPLYWEDYLALHASWSAFVQTPWTLLTYMWVHANLGEDMFHLIFNMLWLYCFGQYFLYYHTPKQLLSVYLWGGFVSGLAYLLLVDYGCVVGASGAIFALVAAVAVCMPDVSIYFNFFVRVVPVKLKWVALFALLFNIANLLQGDNIGGIVCHLGGMAYGVLYGLSERYRTAIEQLTKTVSRWWSPRPRMKATPGGVHKVMPDRQQDIDYNRRRKEHQDRIDAILDKISRSGYDGLTADEKAALFDASQQKKSE